MKKLKDQTRNRDTEKEKKEYAAATKKYIGTHDGVKRGKELTKKGAKANVKSARKLKTRTNAFEKAKNSRATAPGSQNYH